MSEFTSMLAAKAPPADQLRYPLYASPKLDGLRCHVISGTAVSRNLKPFRNGQVQQLYGRKKYDGLDGEFIYGSPTAPDVFRKTTSCVQSELGSTDNLKLFVFDDFTSQHRSFLDRMSSAFDRVKGIHTIEPVPHLFIETVDELEEYEAKCVAQGYEGIMVRDPLGPYKNGRSTTREGWLMKVKRFNDSECVIDGVDELMHNANEKTLVSNGKAKRSTHSAGLVGMSTLGALVVRDLHSGVAFNIGTGFSAADRAELWAMHKAGKLIGKVGTYTFFAGGSKDKPRFPVWKGFREDL